MNRRIKPHQLVLAGGVAFAVVTVLSGIAASVFDFHEDSPIHRTVFGNIPDAYKVIFYTVTPLLLVFGAWNFANRTKNWERGQPDRRELRQDNAHRRVKDWRAGVMMQTLLRDPAAGIMHSLLYYGFFVLLGVTTTLEIDHQLPEDLKFLHGGTYQGFAFVGDVAGVLYLAGVTWAIVRRYIQKPYRIRIKTKPEHAVVLGVLFAIGITGFAAEVFRIAAEGRPSYEEWSIIGYPLSGLVDGIDSIRGWHQAIWISHVLSFFAFLIILPITMMRHMFTSPLNMYLKDKDRPKGAMRAMPDLMETELESFGATEIADFTWKQLLDTDACTMCGRCTSVCPAHATGKPLDPREIVLKTGEVMSATGAHGAVSPPIGVDVDITVKADSVFERITTEELWSCTSCKACDEICPVNIEILDKILDMRRYLTLMESDFPNELGGAFRGMENNANPWNMNNGERGDWALNLDGVEIVDPSDAFEHDYLYWVGCAGSFDDKNRKVSEATANLLNRAGIDFAILGPSEMCTGDSARRSGNE
ncbi:MAG: 4Fe-4S dicluster domain-containing protein, partial [Actinomycetota bacterium]|nr:4Fe-4S dicluster domain-containing protein [Actinomycetota bacterium]